MISVKELVYTYGRDIIYNGADLFVGKGQKVGLVGVNGAGKRRGCQLPYYWCKIIIC